MNNEITQVDIAKLKEDIKISARICHNSLKLYLSYRDFGAIPVSLINSLKSVVDLENDETLGFIRVSFGSIFAYYWLATKTFSYEVNPQGCCGTELLICDSFKKFIKRIDKLADRTIFEEYVDY